MAACEVHASTIETLKRTNANAQREREMLDTQQGAALARIKDEMATLIRCEVSEVRGAQDRVFHEKLENVRREFGEVVGDTMREKHEEIQRHLYEEKENRDRHQDYVQEML